KCKYRRYCNRTGHKFQAASRPCSVICTSLIFLQQLLFRIFTNPLSLRHKNRSMITSAAQFDTELEKYFLRFRQNIIGIDQDFDSPFGSRRIVYTDWTASGRLYRPIEEKMLDEFGPFVANTHTETTV